MSNALIDGFRHHAWATRRLLEFCRSLTDEQLNAGIPGAYGSILAMLKHLLGAEAYYRFLFMGNSPAWDWHDDDESQTIAVMEGWAADLAAFWEELLSRPLDPGGRARRKARRRGGARSEDGHCAGAGAASR